ncbi:MAG TPA: hypothetical protein VFB12_01045 [Ktedonobacteraceae bacterium]|nr:hypothetical protein [Ktedonobacteraceae bacterium]
MAGQRTLAETAWNQAQIIGFVWDVPALHCHGRCAHPNLEPSRLRDVRWE